MADADSGQAPHTPQDPGGTGAGPRAGRARRRVFTSAYKLRILTEYESLNEHGARYALLRREGLYDSNIRAWRTARGKGALKPSRIPDGHDSAATSAQNRKLAADNARLTGELARTKAAMEILGKTCALLEMLSESAD